MAEDPSDLVAQWRFDVVEQYLDVGAGAPVVQGERLSVLNTEDRAIALTAAEMRVESLVSALHDRDLARLAVDAVDQLYRAGTAMSLWSPDISAYVRATWGAIFRALAQRRYRIHYVVEHAHPERIGRPLELYPDLFRAAGISYVCPHAFANDLPDAHDADVNPEALAPFIAEGRRLAVAEAAALTAAGRHLAYVELTPEPGVVDPVLALIEEHPGTIGVHRQGDPNAGGAPTVTLSSRGPAPG